jgi:hypothetical protein
MMEDKKIAPIKNNKNEKRVKKVLRYLFNNAGRIRKNVMVAPKNALLERFIKKRIIAINRKIIGIKRCISIIFVFLEIFCGCLLAIKNTGSVLRKNIPFKLASKKVPKGLQKELPSTEID